jgi:5-methylthioribose kinase
VLIDGQPADGLAAEVGAYCARVLLGTSANRLERPERTALQARFGYSELCGLTEDLVFTAPYTESPTNRYDDQAEHLALALRSDRSLRAAAAELRFLFKTRGEALIHGDLHSGSVMVNAAGTAKIIDLEFAFFGPLGFDLGLLLANLALARLAHEARGNHAYCQVIEGFAESFWTAFTEESHRLWSPGERWYDRFLATVTADAARFAGLEMIRRIVGLAHVKDIDSLPPGQRLGAQERAVAGGRALLLGADCPTFGALWRRAIEEDSYS